MIKTRSDNTPISRSEVKQGTFAQTPYLWSALLSLTLLAAALVGFTLYAEREESRAIHSLAPQTFQQKIQGSALQRIALRQPDLLPVYGSSELLLPDPYHASNLFDAYPTGFTVFPVAKPGFSPLIMLQKMAALGPDLRGKKIALSLPSIDFTINSTPEDVYAGQFSRLHAGELIFSTELSLELKQTAARRMLHYPATLAKDPLLQFATEKLADGSGGSLALYYASLPLGKLQNLVLTLQDHWETLTYLRQHKSLHVEPHRHPTALNWPLLLASAERVAGQKTLGQSIVSKGLGGRKGDPAFPPRPWSNELNEQYLRMLAQTQTWGDLELLLEGLKELGAQPIILGLPNNGGYYDWVGITRQARREYYKKLQEVTQPYGFQVIDFADHDGDPYFLIDKWGHLSAKGWVYYDRALDAFYHDEPLVDVKQLAASTTSESKPGSDDASGAAPIYEGALERVDCRHIRGWAWDRNRPFTPVNVDLFDGDRRLAQVRADHLQVELLVEAKGDGYHSFAYKVPGRLRDGNTHLIRARISGANSDLGKASPLVCHK